MRFNGEFEEVIISCSILYNIHNRCSILKYHLKFSDVHAFLVWAPASDFRHFQDSKNGYISFHVNLHLKNALISFSALKIKFRIIIVTLQKL